MDVYPSYMPYYSHNGCLQRPEENTQSPRTGDINNNEISCGCWEWNPNLLKVWLMMLPMEHFFRTYDLFYYGIWFHVP